MFNCSIHPFKKCSYLNKDSQTLQCPQCLLPSSSFIQSDSQLIDIDELNYMAKTMSQKQNEFDNIYSLIKSFIDNAQTKTYELVDKYYQQILEKLTEKLSSYYEIDGINNILDLINQPQVDMPLYITSISEVHDKLSKLLTKPIDAEILQSQIASQIDLFNSTIYKLTEDNDHFQLESQIIPQNQQFKASRTFSSLNKSQIQINVKQSLDQLTKRDLKSSFQTNYKLSAVTVMTNLVLAGTYCGSILIYDSDIWEEQDCIQDAHQGMIKKLTAKDDWLASGGVDKKIRIWKKIYNEDTCIFKLAQVHELFGHHNTVLDLVLANNNQLISCSADNTVRIWNYVKGIHRVTYSGHKGDIHALAHNDDLNAIISGSQDKSVRVWDSLQCRLQVPIHKLTGHSDSVVGVAVIDKNQIISSSLDKTMRVWNIELGTLIRKFNNLNAVYNLKYLSPGLVLGNIQGQNLEIWDHNIRTCVHVLVAFKGKVTSFEIDERGIFSVSENCICQYY